MVYGKFMGGLCTNYSKNRFFIKNQPLFLRLRQTESRAGDLSTWEGHLFKGVGWPMALKEKACVCIHMIVTQLTSRKVSSPISTSFGTCVCIISNNIYFDNRVTNVCSVVHWKESVFKVCHEQLQSYFLKACFPQKNMTMQWPT